MSYVFCDKGFFVKHTSLSVSYHVPCTTCSEARAPQHDDSPQQPHVYRNTFGNTERSGGCCRKSPSYYGTNDVYNLKRNSEYVKERHEMVFVVKWKVFLSSQWHRPATSWKSPTVWRQDRETFAVDSWWNTSERPLWCNWRILQSCRWPGGWWELVANQWERLKVNIIIKHE